MLHLLALYGLVYSECYCRIDRCVHRYACYEARYPATLCVPLHNHHCADCECDCRPNYAIDNTLCFHCQSSLVSSYISRMDRISLCAATMPLLAAAISGLSFSFGMSGVLSHPLTISIACCAVIAVLFDTCYSCIIS